MRPIGLRFLLKYGSFLDVLMREDEVIRLINSFNTEAFPAVVSGERSAAGPMRWAVLSQDIMALHTFEVAPPARQFTSGMN